MPFCYRSTQNCLSKKPEAQISWHTVVPFHKFCVIANIFGTVTSNRNSLRNSLKLNWIVLFKVSVRALSLEVPFQNSKNPSAAELQKTSILNHEELYRTPKPDIIHLHRTNIFDLRNSVPVTSDVLYCAICSRMTRDGVTAGASWTSCCPAIPGLCLFSPPTQPQRPGRTSPGSPSTPRNVQSGWPPGPTQ